MKRIPRWLLRVCLGGILLLFVFGIVREIEIRKILSRYSYVNTNDLMDEAAAEERALIEELAIDLPFARAALSRAFESSNGEAQRRALRVVSENPELAIHHRDQIRRLLASSEEWTPFWAVETILFLNEAGHKEFSSLISECEKVLFELLKNPDRYTRSMVTDRLRKLSRSGPAIEESLYKQSLSLSDRAPLPVWELSISRLERGKGGSKELKTISSLYPRVDNQERLRAARFLLKPDSQQSISDPQFQEAIHSALRDLPLSERIRFLKEVASRKELHTLYLDEAEKTWRDAAATPPAWLNGLGVVASRNFLCMLASQDESVKPRLKRLIDESIALGDDSALGSIVVEIVRRGETSVRSSREELLAAAEGGSGDAKAIVTALGWREYNDMQVLAILPPAQAPTPRAVHTALSEMLRGLEDPDHFYNALSRAVRRSVFTSEPFSFIPLLSEERLIRGLSTFLGFGAGIQNFFVTGANFSCRPISEKTKAFLSPETVAQYHSIYDSRLCHYHSGEISLPDCSKEG